MSSNHSVAAKESLQDTILHATQVRLLYGGLPMAVFFNVLLGTLLVSVLWPAVNHALAIGWLLLMSVVLLWRVIIFALYRRYEVRKPVLAWLQGFRWSVIAMGAVWGAAALLLFPAGDILHQVFLAFVLAGVSAAAMTSLSADRVSALGFVFAALLPLVFSFLLEGGTLPLSMGLMAALFSLFLSSAAVRMQKTLSENVHLRAESIEQQEALRESEIRLRYMLDICPTAACITRQGGHDIFFCNQNYATLINTSPSHVDSMDPAKYFAHTEEYADILRRLEKGERIYERLVEFKVPVENGSEARWVLASFLRIQYQGEKMVLAWFHDITERIRAELIKSDFVSIVSHELRTPLTSISGSLGLIAEGALGELPAQMHKLFDIANKNSQRLTLLIDDLLDIEKLSSGKLQFDMQSHKLMPLIEQAVALNSVYGAERQVRLQISRRVEDAVVQADSQRLMQVMANLLSNAIKYSPQGDIVEVAVELRGDRVRVTVKDNGSGIPAEFRSRIFKKFAQADSSDTRQKGGTGLGLAITRELVEHMGGVVGFVSVEGQGASFYIELPLNK